MTMEKPGMPRRHLLRTAAVGVPAMGALSAVNLFGAPAAKAIDLETDGFAYHSSYSAWMRDRQRDQALLARGLLPLRLTYDDVMAGRTVSLVEAALAGFGRRNGALGGSFGWAPAGPVALSAESCGNRRARPMLRPERSSQSAKTRRPQ